MNRWTRIALFIAILIVAAIIAYRAGYGIGGWVATSEDTIEVAD